MDLFCENCGSKIESGCDFCTNCGQKVNKQGENRPPENSNYQRQPLAGNGDKLSQIVTLADGEVVVKEYFCTKVKRPRCEGTLSVTNKRIIFHGQGSSSRIQKEVPLKLVSGLDTYYGINFDFVKIILGVIIILVSLFIMRQLSEVSAYMGTTNNSFIYGLLFIVIGAILIYLGIQPCFILSLYASGTDGAPIQIGNPPISLIGNSALYSLSAQKSYDTDLMMKELGAMVEELQTMGDLAIQKWKQ